MYIQIHSVDEDNIESSGKTTFVAGKKYDLKVEQAISFDPNDHTDWIIELTHTGRYDGSSSFTKIERSAKLRLDVDDIEKIINLLVKENLLEVSALRVKQSYPYAEEVPTKQPEKNGRKAKIKTTQ